jgi:hypothetical protein
MKSHILTALALLGLLTFAIPITASARDKHYNDRNHRWVCDDDGDDCEPAPTYNRWNCDEDEDDCEPATYYGGRYMNPGRSYGPAYDDGYNGYGYPGCNNGYNGSGYPGYGNSSDSWSNLLGPLLGGIQ